MYKIDVNELWRKIINEFSPLFSFIPKRMKILTIELIEEVSFLDVLVILICSVSSVFQIYYKIIPCCISLSFIYRVKKMRVEELQITDI